MGPSRLDHLSVGSEVVQSADIHKAIPVEVIVKEVGKLEVTRIERLLDGI